MNRSKAKKTPILRRLVLLIMTAAMFGLSPVALSKPVAAASNWVNTQDRQAVIDAYDAEFGGTEPNPGWTGNRSSCNSGTTSQAYRNAIFSRVNYFRGMAGVPAGITENATWSAMAQESALMMSASARLSHYPDASFSCFTADGATASASSDLYLGRTGPHAITGYMEDPGNGNTRVGHRNWILHPTTNQMGTGDIPADGNGWASNTLWVFDNVFGAQPTLRENTGMVAWPPRGFVPGEVVFPRWSLSIRDGDFSGASVTMTTGGQTVSQTVVHRDGATGGAPFPIIVWEPQTLDLTPTFDVTYDVIVTGAKVNGNPTTFSYSVTIIGSQTSEGYDPNAYDDFITQAYEDFIGRAPTTSEISYWAAQLSSGSTLFDMVEALSNSDAWTANIVNQLYINTLGRPADQAGRDYWTARLQNGASVAEVAASFYGSPEYVANKGGTYDLWLADIYQVLLNRGADKSGLDYWRQQTVANGTGTVAYRFYQSQESREARVRDLYQQFLGRNPDAAGLAYWSRILESGDDLALAANLASSDEYFSRASE